MTEATPVIFHSASATGTGPAKIEIGGHDIARHARSISIHSEVGAMATVTVEAYALGGLDVTLPAQVIVNILPLEEGEMDVTTLDDGSVRYRFVRKRAE